jgi:hypothetical protein
MAVMRRRHVMEVAKALYRNAPAHRGVPDPPGDWWHEIPPGIRREYESDAAVAIAALDLLTPREARVARDCVADVYRVQTDDDPEPNEATVTWRKLRALAVDDNEPMGL